MLMAIEHRMSATDYITAGATVATALFLGVGLYQQMKDRLPKIYLEQFDDTPPLRPDGTRVIRVRSNGVVEKCRVTYGGKELDTYLPRGPVKMTTLYIGGVLNFRVPVGVPVTNETDLEVWDDTRLLRRVKMGSINPAQSR